MYRRKRKLNIITILFTSIIISGIILSLCYVFSNRENSTYEDITKMGNGSLSDNSNKIQTQALSGESAVRAYADENGIPMSAYPSNLLSVAEKNPEMAQFVMEYPIKKDISYDIDLADCSSEDSVPLFMQWDQRWGYKSYAGNIMGLSGCGPTCLSMVAVYLTGNTDLDPAWMADFSTENGYAVDGDGTAWSLMLEGGKKLGFDAEELAMDDNAIISNLKSGNPIICMVGPGDFTDGGHYIVMTGYKDGMVMINDPNSRVNSEKLWKLSEIEYQFKNLWVYHSVNLSY